MQGARYMLESEVRPSVIDTLEVAQRVRRYLMGIHGRIAGQHAVSWKFSGKDRTGTPLAGHRHAYILPLDFDRDGWLDHLVVHCREPFDQTERMALIQLERIWQGDGKPEIRFAPIQCEDAGDLFPAARVFASATPFVPPRHYRKGRGDFREWLAGEVRREAVNHGLPAPVRVSPLARLMRGGRSLSWLEFTRSRKNDRMEIGYGFKLEFAQPVSGPIALGYGAHFGLGQFEPVD